MPACFQEYHSPLANKIFNYLALNITNQTVQRGKSTFKMSALKEADNYHILVV